MRKCSLFLAVGTNWMLMCSCVCVFAPEGEGEITRENVYEALNQIRSRQWPIKWPHFAPTN